MSNSSRPTSRSGVSKTFQTAANTAIFGVLLSPIVFSLYSALWAGHPIAITCQDVDSIRVDCTLKYRALLRSSEQKVRDVRGISVDIQTSSSEGESTTSYVATLHSQSGDRPIKTYPFSNDRELENLTHRLNRFFINPKEKLTIPIQYNPWQPIGVLVIVLFAIVLSIPLLGILASLSCCQSL